VPPRSFLLPSGDRDRSTVIINSPTAERWGIGVVVHSRDKDSKIQPPRWAGGFVTRDTAPGGGGRALYLTRHKQDRGER